jgi:predicted NBD/HSP70 family sugar kinase
VLEDIAAGPAITAAYERRSGRRVAGAESVLAAAAERDAEAMAVVDAAADQLGPLVALIVNMLDPAAILFGGGLGLAPGRYRDRLVAAMCAHVWAESCRDCRSCPRPSARMPASSAPHWPRCPESRVSASPASGTCW